MEEEKKKKLKKCDWMVGFIFVAMIAVRIFTLLYLSQTAEITGAQIESIVEIFEVNPLAKMQLNLKSSAFMLTSLVIPSFAVAIYLYFRRKVMQDKMDVDHLDFYVNLVFLIMLLNLINDWANFMGKYIQLHF